MIITRLDLDGKGKGSPEGLVTAILGVEKNLSIPVPIEELCKQLDIENITELTTEGFAGGLITDTVKSSGIILVNNSHQRQKRRFTIGHELGHFLIPTHMPNKEGRFLCSSEDMRQLSSKELNHRLRMEVEANRFSSLILMPPPILRKEMASFSDANLEHILSLARTFDVSKEAAVRAYAEYHDERIAIAVIKNGVVERIYKNATKFPKLCVINGSPVPKGSVYYLLSRETGSVSSIRDVKAELWLETDWGVSFPALYEQVCFQQNGYALIMLWADASEEDGEDQDEGRTSKERLRDRQSRWI